VAELVKPEEKVAVALLISELAAPLLRIVLSLLVLEAEADFGLA
jgi:hypothetical protein